MQNPGGDSAVVASANDPLFEQSENSLYARFLHFHIKYPSVYIFFERFSLQLIQAGRKKIGAKMIAERVRWECYTGSKDEREFKINNNFIAYYARLFTDHHPEFQSYFEFRSLKQK
jgi:hypothetical protein